MASASCAERRGPALCTRLTAEIEPLACLARFGIRPIHDLKSLTNALLGAGCYVDELVEIFVSTETHGHSYAEPFGALTAPARFYPAPRQAKYSLT